MFLSKRLLTVTRLIVLILCFSILNTSLPHVTPVAAAPQSERVEYLERRQLDEIIAERTENMTVYQNSDGTKTAYIYEDPIRYRDKDGILQDIDNTIISYKSTETETDSEYKYKNKSNLIDIYFPNDIVSDEDVCLEYGKYKVELKPKGDLEVKELGSTETPESPEAIEFPELEGPGESSDLTDSAESDGKTPEPLVSVISDKFRAEPLFDEKGSESITAVEYLSNYAEEISIKYTPTSDGLKEDIVIHHYTGQNSFQFLINLTGLTPKLDETGQILLKDIKTDDLVGVMPKPYMFDSFPGSEDSEGVNYSEEVRYEIKQLNDGEYLLTVVADKGFLEDENTVYPVTIDPTIKIDTRTEQYDAYVLSRYPGYNYINNVNLVVGYSSTLYKARSFVSHPLPDLNGGIIVKAQYSAYCYTDYDTTAYIGLYRVTGSWSSGTITWNNQPASSASYEQQISVGNTGWYTWDLTKLASQWYSGVYPNYGFVLKDSTEDKRFRGFYSSDSTINKPCLEIVYLDKPATPSATTYGNNINNPTGYVSLSLPAISGIAGYKVGIYNGKSYEWFDAGSGTSWSTQGEKIWPTVAEIQSGRYLLHHDSAGTELPNDPVQTYINSWAVTKPVIIIGSD